MKLCQTMHVELTFPTKILLDFIDAKENIGQFVKIISLNNKTKF